MSQEKAFEVLYQPEAFVAGAIQRSYDEFEMAVNLAIQNVFFESDGKWKVFRKKEASSIESVEGDLVFAFVVPKERGGDPREKLHEAISFFESTVKHLSHTRINPVFRTIEGENS